jgi:hypothetical protein
MSNDLHGKVLCLNTIVELKIAESAVLLHRQLSCSCLRTVVLYSAGNLDAGRRISGALSSVDADNISISDQLLKIC